MMNEGTAEILPMLSGHELALKHLYEVFLNAFPDHEGLWSTLAADEQKHSDWLETLRSDPASAGMMQNEIQLKPQAIRTSTLYVEQQVQKARDGIFNPIQALSIARDLENALIEKIFSKLSHSPSGRIRALISTLTGETEKHRDMLAKALESEKQKVP